MIRESWPCHSVFSRSLLQSEGCSTRSWFSLRIMLLSCTFYIDFHHTQNRNSLLQLQNDAEELVCHDASVGIHAETNMMESENLNSFWFIYCQRLHQSCSLHLCFSGDSKAVFSMEKGNPARNWDQGVKQWKRLRWFFVRCEEKGKRATNMRLELMWGHTGFPVRTVAGGLLWCLPCQWPSILCRGKAVSFASFYIWKPQGSFKASTMLRFCEDPDGAGAITGEDARCLAKTELIIVIKMHSVWNIDYVASSRINVTNIFILCSCTCTQCKC